MRRIRLRLDHCGDDARDSARLDCGSCIAARSHCSTPLPLVTTHQVTEQYVRPYSLSWACSIVRVRWSPALHPQRPLGPLRLSGVALRVHLWCPRVRRGPSSAKR